MYNKGWLCGNAKLPKQVPATEEQKWLIEPTGKDNWIYSKGVRIPNGLITVLLKLYWPGLYCPDPVRQPDRRVLATSWDHWEAALHADHETHAKAVITTFWKFYRVLSEHRARADQIVLRQCKKKARQM